MVIPTFFHEDDQIKTDLLEIKVNELFNMSKNILLTVLYILLFSNNIQIASKSV